MEWQTRGNVIIFSVLNDGQDKTQIVSTLLSLKKKDGQEIRGKNQAKMRLEELFKDNTITRIRMSNNDALIDLSNTKTQILLRDVAALKKERSVGLIFQKMDLYNINKKLENEKKINAKKKLALKKKKLLGRVKSGILATVYAASMFLAGTKLEPKIESKLMQNFESPNRFSFVYDTERLAKESEKLQKQIEYYEEHIMSNKERIFKLIHRGSDIKDYDIKKLGSYYGFDEEEAKKIYDTEVAPFLAGEYSYHDAQALYVYNLEKHTEGEPKEVQIEQTTNEQNERLILKAMDALGINDLEEIITALATYRVETGRGTSDLFITQNNFGGVTGKDGFETYETKWLGALGYVRTFKMVADRERKDMEDPQSIPLAETMSYRYCTHTPEDWQREVMEVMNEVVEDYGLDVLLERYPNLAYLNNNSKTK